MRDPSPTVVLVPGLGMIAWGKDKSESRVTAEFYNCAVEVMRGAEAIDRYEAMRSAGGFRHRVLVARRGETAPACRPRRNWPARSSCGRRRVRHRQGDGPATRQGRRARRLRGPRRGRGEDDRGGDRRPLRHRDRRRRDRPRATAGRPSGSAATSRIGDTVACMLGDVVAGVRRPRRGGGHRGHLRGAGQRRADPRRPVGDDVRR